MNHIKSGCDMLVQAGVLQASPLAEPVYNAGLAVTDGLVVETGSFQDMGKRYTPHQVLDLCSCLVLPGLINSHTHAAMSIFRGFADDMPLMQWLERKIWPAEAKLCEEIIYAGSLLSGAEMLATGCTCFADMYMFEEQVALAAESLGMRAVLGEGILGFATKTYKTTEEAFARIEELTVKYKDSSLLHTAVAPHAIYTTTPEILIQAMDLAEKLDVPFIIHVAESDEETKKILELFGKTPVDFLYHLSLLGPRTVLVHACTVTEKEIEHIAEMGAHVAHNVRSNMKLGSGICPVALFLDKGVNICLGTDGAASNNSLNMFQEMHAASVLQKAFYNDPVLFSARDTFAAATTGGARALGRPELGTLTPGSMADFTALDLYHPSLLPLHNPLSHIVYAATGAEVVLTAVGGKVVYDRGTYPNLPSDELTQAMAAVKAWFKL